MPRSFRVLGAVIVFCFVVQAAGCGRQPHDAAELSEGAAFALPDGPLDGRSAGDRALDSALEAAGVEVPPGANVYAAVIENAQGVRSDEFEVGGGSSATEFWPASSIKVIAAVGALTFLHAQGFSGAASVEFADGSEWPVRETYRAALVHSDNYAYDALVAIAGVDWLNTVFLTPENGFPVTVLQKAYADYGQVSAGSMTVREDGRELELPSRAPSDLYGVPDGGNRSNLAEMTDAVRRVLLHYELPPGERFGIDHGDVSGLRADLLAAEGFIDLGAEEALGRDVLVYGKPGHVVGADCVDVAFVPRLDGRAFLLGISTPDDGEECATVIEIARHTLEFLDRRS